MSTKSTTSEAKPTFAEQVNSYVSSVERSPEGELIFPDELKDNEAMQYAVTTEIRRRDTQSIYDKNQAELLRIKAENEAMAKSWEEDAVQNLSKAEKAELDELKHTDPDAWRVKMDELDKSARSKFQEKRTEVTSKAQKETELQRRTRLLEEFQEANPSLTINDEVIENEIPPKYLKQLEKGEVSFEEFLDNVANYLTKGKVIKKDDDELLTTTNLSKVGGKSTPSDEAIEADIHKTYENTIF